jgi:hypothetical protein
VSGQSRRDVVHDEIRLGGHVVAADNLAVRVDGDLAGQLQEGPVAELDARYVGVPASRGWMGAATVEIPSSHVAMVSHPGDVAQLIKTAAEAVQAMT